MAHVSTVAPLHFTLTDEPALAPGIFSRLLAAMVQSRQKQAEQGIARYLANSGGKFTDESEREIERHLLGGSSHW